MKKLVLELPFIALNQDRVEEQIGTHGSSNKIANGSVEILRLPEDKKQAVGKRIGDRVEGRLVFQYIGPITLTWVDDAARSPVLRGSRRRSSTKVAATRRKPVRNKTHRTPKGSNRGR